MCYTKTHDDYLLILSSCRVLCSTKPEVLHSAGPRVARQIPYTAPGCIIGHLFLLSTHRARVCFCTVRMLCNPVPPPSPSCTYGAEPRRSVPGRPTTRKPNLLFRASPSTEQPSTYLTQTETRSKWMRDDHLPPLPSSAVAVVHLSHLDSARHRKRRTEGAHRLLVGICLSFAPLWLVKAT